MRKTAKVATALILIGISAAGAVEIERYCARAAVRAVVTGFNGKRAFNDLRQLVQLGPRPAGSENLERARAYIERQLSAAGAEIRDDPFVATTPMGKIPMTNVIGVINGESPTVVILAGHYDTARIDGVQFVGANDGGSSAALLLEMARVLTQANEQVHLLAGLFRWGRSPQAMDRRAIVCMAAGIWPKNCQRREVGSDQGLDSCGHGQRTGI